MALLINSTLDNHYYTHGFCVLVNKAIDIATQHKQNHGGVVVSVQDPQLEQIFKWESPGLLNIDTFKNLVYDSEGQDPFPYPDNLSERWKTFFAAFIVHSEIQRELNRAMLSLITEKTLGVHLRGTDKPTEYPAIEMKLVYRMIDLFLKQNDVDRIFLATDDVRLRDPIIHRYGVRTVMAPDQLISENGNPIHLHWSDRVRTNKEAFTNAYLLSQCKYLAYCNSNLSFLALTMGNNTISKRINLQPLAH